MAIKGFDSSYYVSALLDYFQEKYPTDWQDKTTANVEKVISVDTGMDYSAEAAELYYTTHLDQGVAPNEFFDAAEYRLSFAAKSVEQGYTLSQAEALAQYDAAIAETNDSYGHYLSDGAAIGANPSNLFDESSYMQNIIDTLEWDGVTVDALRDFIIENGYTPLDLYLSYPESHETLPAFAVEGDEIVVVPAADTTGQTFTLTNVADNIPGLIGSDGDTDNAKDDVIVANELTLTAGDKINGGTGYDELKVSSDATKAFSAFEMDKVEEITVTADGGNDLTFDLSGTDDLEVVRTLNSTGDVTFNEVTKLANIEANNMTDEADLTVMFQDSAVSADNDSVNVRFVNSINADIDTITIGSETNPNNDIETINIEVDGKGDFTDIAVFDAGMETLNIISGPDDGEQDLIIRSVLSDDVATVNAQAFTADLTLNFSGATGVTYDGASGVDTITFGANGDNTINTYAGNDVVTLNLGDDTVDLGDGDDILNIGTNGLTVADTISGGDGTDTINLNGADTIQLSEAEQVTDVEIFNMTTAGSLLVVSNNMVNTVDNDPALFTVNMGVGGNTVDISNVTFDNTAKIAINGTTGDDLVIADDATVNAKASIAFGIGTDTLQIVDGATITADDLANITGLDVISLVADSSDQQDWHIDPVNDVTISVDADVQEGSRLYIDTSDFTGTAVTVNSNTNMIVYVDNVVVPVGGSLNGVTVISKLEFTENSDTLVGAGTFIGDSLDRFDIGDSVTATGTADELLLNFQVNNANQTLAAQLNLFSDADTLETVTFNTDNAVSFSDISNTAGTLNGITVVNFGNGTSTVSASNTGATYNFGDANDSYTAAAAVTEILNGGAGDDTYSFGDITYYAAGDMFTGNTGTDTINVTNNNAAGLIQAVHDPASLVAPTLSGIDVINLNVTTSADNGFSVSNTAVDQSDDGDLLTLTLVDGNAVANTSAIFDATDVRMGNAVNLTVTGLDNAEGYSAGAAANDVANYVNVDVLGGAGNDTLTIGGGVEGYAVAGNAGADMIDISGVGENDAWVVYQSSNDGGNAGENTGYDTIKGFVSGQDAVAFLNVNFGATDFAGTGAGSNLVAQSDAPVDFTGNGDNALVMTQIGTGMTDAELLDLNQVAVNANVHGVTADPTNGGFIVAQGQSKSALYMYVEQDGTANNVAVGELKMLAVFDDTNAFGNNASDMQYVVNVDPNAVVPGTLTYSATTFAEAPINDGSIVATSILTLTGDTFADAVGTDLGAMVSNVPAGLTASLIVDTATTATLSFTGNATAHEDANDVADLTVDLSAAAFTSGVAATGATNSTLAIDFNDASAFTDVDLAGVDVTATAAAEAFIYDFQMVGGRVTTATDGFVKITGFDVATDKLVFQDAGTGTVYSEADFAALPGVVISENAFALPSGETSFYFDPNAGVVGGVTLAGVIDAALTNIVVETLA